MFLGRLAIIAALCWATPWLAAEPLEDTHTAAVIAPAGATEAPSDEFLDAADAFEGPSEATQGLPADRRAGADAVPEAGHAPRASDLPSGLDEPPSVDVLDQLLQTQFDVRGGAWIEDAGLVNPADYRLPANDDEALQKMLREIEAAAAAREHEAAALQRAAGTSPTSDQPTAPSLNEVLVASAPHEVLSWAREHRDLILIGGSAALLLAWMAGAIVPALRKPRRRRRQHRREPVPSLAVRRRRRRRRRTGAPRQMPRPAQDPGHILADPTTGRH
jgi:hypothetical protein